MQEQRVLRARPDPAERALRETSGLRPERPFGSAQCLPARRREYYVLAGATLRPRDLAKPRLTFKAIAQAVCLVAHSLRALAASYNIRASQGVSPKAGGAAAATKSVRHINRAVVQLGTFFRAHNNNNNSSHSDRRSSPFGAKSLKRDRCALYPEQPVTFTRWCAIARLGASVLMFFILSVRVSKN